MHSGCKVMGTSVMQIVDLAWVHTLAAFWMRSNGGGGAYGAPGSETNIMVQAVMVGLVVCHSVLIARSRKCLIPRAEIIQMNLSLEVDAPVVSLAWPWN